jgi:iron(III) transport system ATP-binding protein
VTRARDGLAQVGLGGYDARQPSELSGGQQQRVAVARALVLKPSVLLFDEPLSNLDARLRRQMREEIRELQQRLALTVVYVTHDEQEAMAVSDRIIVMNAGRIEQQGTPRDLYERPATPFLARFMGESNPAQGIVRRLDTDRIAARLGDTELERQPELLAHHMAAAGNTGRAVDQWLKAHRRFERGEGASRAQLPV